jgi:hypothetical protein
LASKPWEISDVISVSTNVDDSAKNNQTESNPKVLLFIETDEQKESLFHPIRKHILRVLSAGTSEYETEVTREVQTLEDGTGLTRLIEVKRPVQRYWMAVPEIVEMFGQRYPKHKITNYQCYYHLQKLGEQGLVEQDPPFEFDDYGRKKRTRGLQFRSAARFFIYHKSKFLHENSNPCIEFLQNGWGLKPSEEDCEQLTQLILEQDQALFKALEHLMSNMNESAIDSLTFSVLLDRFAHVLLSDNDEFIERYRDAKKILVRSSGEHLDADRMWTIPNGIDNVKEEETRGSIDE